MPSSKGEFHIRPLDLPRLSPERALAVRIQEEDLLGQRIADHFWSGRSLQFKATVIIQSLNDLDESDQTCVLLENARTKLILGLNRDSSAVARAANLLGLGEQEAAYLASCRLVKGVGATALLLADGERTPLMIPMWPEAIHQLVTVRASAP